ncbi:TPA: tetratricopeptide repeat protein, partial [Haemophilus influenzae]
MKKLSILIAIIGLTSSLAAQALTQNEFEHYLKQAKIGDPEAQYILGLAYETGEIVPKNIIEAERLYRESAGVHYGDPKFIYGNVNASIRLAKLTLENDLPTSSFNSLDFQEAINTLIIAAFEYKDQEAMMILADIYYNEKEYIE